MLLLSACSGDIPDSNSVQQETSPRTKSAPAELAADLALLGSAEGLGLGERTVGFGSPLTDAVAVAEAAGGRSDPPQELEECSAGPLVAIRVGNISLYGEKEQFIGWHISESGPLKLRTNGGVGIGTARSELDAAHTIEVFESSVGDEFHSADGLGGLLSDPSQAAKVTHLWAGLTCIMR